MKRETTFLGHIISTEGIRAKIVKPMTLCLKKGAKINTNDPSYIEAFEKLKTLISNDPILIHPDFEKKIDLTTDASNYALGAVLPQEGNPFVLLVEL